MERALPNKVILSEIFNSEDPDKVGKVVDPSKLTKKKEFYFEIGLIAARKLG